MIKTYLTITCAIVASLAIGCFSSTSVAQTPLIHYTFDENSGSTAYDSGSGVPANGTLSGTAAWSTNTPSGTGGSLQLVNNGTDGNSVTADSAKLAGLSQFTITMWFNAQADLRVGDRLLSTLAPGTFQGLDFNVQAPSSGGISASDFRLSLLVNGVSGSSAAVSSAGTSVNADSQWMFLVVSYDGTLTNNNVLFYTGTADSVVGQLGAAITLNTGAVGSVTGALQIGNTQATTSDRTPGALFDDVRIYSGVLDINSLENIRLSNIPESTTWPLLIGMAMCVVLMLRRR